MLERSRAKKAERLNTLIQRIEDFKHKHNALSKLVNEVVMPNLRGISEIARSHAQVAKLVSKNIIYIEIIIKKLNITEEEFNEAANRLRNPDSQDS